MQKKSDVSSDLITYENAKGPIKYSLTGDLMFHYVMQKSKKALLGLVCSLKGINPSIVKDIIVMNPIDLSSNLKETVMDLKLLLNSGEIINIELQTYTDKYWIYRSLLYLCRAFDDLKEGEDYSKLKPTTHFCITTQDLFADSPEFYSKFLLLNVKTNKPYTKNFGINVLQLRHIDMATQEDNDNNLVYWAKIFNASTWEEFRLLTKDDPAMKEVGNLILTLNTDGEAAAILEGQRRYRENIATAHAIGVEEAEERLGAIIAEKDATIAKKNAQIAELEKRLRELEG